MVASDLRMFVASGLDPQAMYAFAVAAKTSAGWGQKAVGHVHVVEKRAVALPPSRPYHGRQHLRSSTELQVAWDDFSTLKEPTRFAEVQFQSDGEDRGRWTLYGDRPVGSNCIVRFLRPATSYQFRVRVHNDFGFSSWSDASEWLKTSEAEPSHPPSNVQATAFNSSSILVSWEPPEISSWNSQLIGYRILHKIYGKNDLWHIHELPMSGHGNKMRHKFFITGLMRFSHYVIQLQAFNQLGSSPPTDAQFVYVAYAVPANAVTGLRGEALSSTELKILWDLWPSSWEPIIGFKISYHPAQTEEEAKQDTVENDATFVLLGELRKFTTYRVSVIPFNRAGDGLLSSIEVTTSADIPGPVGSLTFSDISVDSVNVSWMAPAEPNGKILGYRVTYRTGRFDN
ncbi:unnamed protein product, partial [Soboliphyme baturini]|uniref:Fibronectin type-III domain-containing protein n=1 Tax=Soboliphyme baturini TaxID=241478 RepID=A0A183J999_9BILA